MRGTLARVAALFALLGLLAGRPAAAQEMLDQALLVNRAVTTVERLKADSSFQALMQSHLANARAVMIVPNLVKAGFILGGEYGNAALLVKGDDGSWSSPAFYTIAAGSLGLQIGVQDSEVMFAIMSDKGLSAIMNNNFKLGADVAVAFMTLGAGMEASSTTNMGADVIAFSRNIGMFGGGAFEGAVIKPRASWNAAYYMQGATPEAILLDRTLTNPQADRLRDILAR